MGALHAAGLTVAANLHDANGVGPWEDEYAEVAAAAGWTNASAPVPFTLTDMKYTDALEDIVLGAREKEGLDFYWIDWQQGEDKGNTGQDARLKMNPTIGLSKLRVTDAARRCAATGRCSNRKRGVVFARWGGLGNHRYQHGFSGDVAGLSWENLAYQAYFSATASNVGFGFWSHDIEGPANDPEMCAAARRCARERRPPPAQRLRPSASPLRGAGTRAGCSSVPTPASSGCTTAACLRGRAPAGRPLAERAVRPCSPSTWRPPSWTSTERRCARGRRCYRTSIRPAASRTSAGSG